MDYVTVLESANRKRLTKTFKYDYVNGHLSKTSYELETQFRPERHEVRDLPHLVERLGEIAKRPDACIIRGEPSDDYELVSRRLHDGPKGRAHLKPGAHHWMLLDIDRLVLPKPMSHVAALVYAVKQLPKEFIGADFYWRLSASAGIGEATLFSCHLIFWSETALTDKQLAEWSKHLNKCVKGFKLVDPQAFASNQPLYTATPLFIGVNDPCPLRCGFYEGDRRSVALTLPDADWDAQQRRRAWEERCKADALTDAGLPFQTREKRKRERDEIERGGYRYWLGEIGDHSGRGFHEPINLALWHYVSEGGTNFKRAKAEVRAAARAAPNFSARDLNQYLSDGELDRSLQGAVARLPPPPLRGSSSPPNSVVDIPCSQALNPFYEVYIDHQDVDVRAGEGGGQKETQKQAFLRLNKGRLLEARHKTAAEQKPEVETLHLDKIKFIKVALWFNKADRSCVARFDFSLTPAVTISDWSELSQREIHFFGEHKFFARKLKAKGNFTPVAERYYKQILDGMKARKPGDPTPRIGIQMAIGKHNKRKIAFAEEEQFALLQWREGDLPYITLTDGTKTHRVDLEWTQKPVPNGPAFVGYFDPGQTFMAHRDTLAARYRQRKYQKAKEELHRSLRRAAGC